METAHITEPESSDEQVLPLTSEMIGKLQGQKPLFLNSKQVRRLNRMASGYTGCIVLVVSDGVLVPDGVYTVKQFTIAPAEKQD